MSVINPQDEIWTIPPGFPACAIGHFEAEVVVLYPSQNPVMVVGNTAEFGLPITVGHRIIDVTLRPGGIAILAGVEADMPRRTLAVVRVEHSKDTVPASGAASDGCHNPVRDPVGDLVVEELSWLRVAFADEMIGHPAPYNLAHFHDQRRVRHLAIFREASAYDAISEA